MSDPGRPPRVVITNVYPDDNRGGAAITAAAIEIARAVVPGAEITLLSVSGEVETLGRDFRFTHRANPDVEILPAPFVTPDGSRLETAKALASSIGCLLYPALATRRNVSVKRLSTAALVMGKGGQAFRNAKAKELLSLWFTSAPLLIANRAGAPTAVVAASVGPFRRSRLIRLLAGFVLRRLTVVLPRGERSAATLRGLGVDAARIRVVPDSVFRYEPPEAELVEKMLDRYDLEPDGYLAMTLTGNMARADLRPMTFPAFDQILKSALDTGLVQKVVVVVQTDGTTTDLPASQDFVSFVADERISLITDEHSPEELIALYAGAAATIGGRVHSSVFSIVGATLTFPIEFGGDKSRDIFGPEFEDRILHPLTEDAGSMQDRVQRLLSRRDELQVSLYEDSRRRRVEARRTESFLREALAERKR